MKTILFLSLVFGCNLIANAHQTVKSSDIDNLHFGDSIHYDLVDASKISAINLTGSLWDFSNIKYLGQEKEVCFIGDMEGHVKLIGQDEILDFKDGANADVEYFYDANGALVKDLNKGISNIEYDVLGNLKCITFNNGFTTKYVYDAAGNKLRTTHESVITNTTDYIDNFVFEDGKLDKYLFDGGYCSFDNNQNPTFHYYEKDHLGSIRMVVNENGTIEQVNHYYPFGGVYGDLSYNSEYQKSKYIGKEFDHMHGLDWYDHGARMYDAARVAWDKTERLYGKFNNWNLYCYGLDNPIKFIDKDGREPGDFFESPEKAALDFALFYNDNSIRDNKEFASSINYCV